MLKPPKRFRDSNQRPMATGPRFRKWLVVFVHALSIVALCSVAHAEDPREIAVSLIQLIANPTAFDGKRVLVVGYLTVEFENEAIWLSELDAKHGITRNSLWLYVSDPVYANRARFHNRYGLVVGTFNAHRRGHLSLSGGAIENITRLEPH
ncbi:MAG TPA: hypothetical protein VFO18_16945 [Methylomirabilota bacterium]|nr:hypothetical protein [Methylomirabilota bacterium]